MLMIFFICGTIESAKEVAYNFSDMTYQASPLPSDCHWLEGDRPQLVATYLLPVDAIFSNGLWYTIAKVETGAGHRGYSAGKPFTS